MCVQIWSSMDDAMADGRRLSQSRLMQQICNFLHGARGSSRDLLAPTPTPASRVSRREKHKS